MNTKVIQPNPTSKTSIVEKLPEISPAQPYEKVKKSPFNFSTKDFRDLKDLLLGNTKSIN